MTVAEVINNEKGKCNKYVVNIEKNGFCCSIPDSDIEIYKRMGDVFSSLLNHKIFDYSVYEQPATFVRIICVQL